MYLQEREPTQHLTFYQLPLFIAQSNERTWLSVEEAKFRFAFFEINIFLL